jgi:epoxyqueuosine reductase
LSAKTTDGIENNPAGFIKRQIEDFVNNSPDSHLSFMNDYVMWDEPLVKFANGDEAIFTEYRNIIVSTHLTPRDALVKAYKKHPEICQIVFL